MYQPKARWTVDGDSSQSLMWGHIKVGEVAKGGSGNWYAYYRRNDQDERMWSLRDFPDQGLAKAAVEHALVVAAA